MVPSILIYSLDQIEVDLIGYSWLRDTEREPYSSEKEEYYVLNLALYDRVKDSSYKAETRVPGAELRRGSVDLTQTIEERVYRDLVNRIFQERGAGACPTQYREIPTASALAKSADDVAKT